MGIYSPNGVNNNTGRVLGYGSNTNSLMSVTNPSTETADKAVDPTYATGTEAGGTINYFRTADIVNVVGTISSINGTSDSVVPTANLSTNEVHTSNSARKYAVSSIDIHGRPTYGTFHGSGYDLTSTTGNVYDRAADAMNDPYGTPAKFYSLVGLAPVTHTYNSLTSY